MFKPIATILVGLTAFYGSAAAAQDASDWANELLASWYDAYRAQDAERLAKNYSKDALLNDAKGQAEIIAAFESEFAEAHTSCLNTGFEGFRQIGLIAAGWGTDTCVVTPTNGDAPGQRTTR